MCGIVGLFLKDRSLEPRLGALLTDMLVTMTDRGPDSAGIAIYGGEAAGSAKLTVQSDDPQADFATLAEELGSVIDAAVSGAVKDSHIVLTLPADKVAAARQALPELRQGVRVMSTGAAMEIYKEVGLPRDVAARFAVSQMSGSHGIGHTRMATESAVTTLGAHPFSTGLDQCLVHNGSLSNHNALRRKLRREGIHIETENDTEVGAAYLTWKMQTGSSLGEALKMGRSEDKGGGRDKTSILGDACEALIAAIYLDGGRPAVQAFYDRFWGPKIEALKAKPKDPKSALQEWAARVGHAAPRYTLTERSGPDHRPVFTVEVFVAPLDPAVGEGGSKQAAERHAATTLLKREGQHV